jgi:hypothetical protein
MAYRSSTPCRSRVDRFHYPLKLVQPANEMVVGLPRISAIRQSRRQAPWQLGRLGRLAQPVASLRLADLFLHPYELDE